jgi:hypothetical protein
MKQRDKYFLVLMIFLMIMVLVLSYFYNRYNNTGIVNESKELLGDIYSLKSGEYELKNGLLFNSNKERVNDKEYIKASGIIYVDKYLNVRFKLNIDNSCISKTSLGNIKFEKNHCTDYKKISVQMTKNNNYIAFETNDILEYMVSDKDDFKGIWKKQEDNKNIIINSYSEGKNYIWFKDSDGNLSKTYTFSIDCLDTNNARYKSNIFYCSGSTIILDDIKWIVIKDSNTNIKLMKYMPLDKKMEFTTNKNDFRWSTSSINYYLNSEFINELSSDTINNLISTEICDDYDSTNCNNEVCGGRSKEEMEENNYMCSVYINSKVKLISYDEFNYAYVKSKNKEVLGGNYWSINSINYKNGTSILNNFDYYILENPTNKLDIKPVIIVNK